MGRDDTLVLLCLIGLFSSPALGDSPSAGFIIRDEPVIYYRGGAILPKPIEVRVENICGFNVTPLESVQKGKPGENVVFRHSLENLGNDTEQITFKVKSAPPGCRIKVMAEDQEVVGRLPLQEGAVLNFWVMFKTPDTVPANKSYALEMTVSGQAKDGNAYYGYDGQLHGGKDEFTLTDRIQL